MSKDQPWSIRKLIDWTKTFLQSKGVPSANLDAGLLLAHALGCSRMDLYTRMDDVPSDADRAKYRELVQRRVKGCPVARLLGRRDFFKLEFEVTPDVLVPRPETEWVVTTCLPLARQMAAPRVLDVGTGSGCIAVSMAHDIKTAVVTATDLSESALEVARRNATKHKVAERMRFLQGDLFAPLSADEQFDFIVSNPPYIATAVIPTLDAEVREYDPILALDGGPDGYAIIERLIAEAPAYLAPGGSLIVEIGYDQEAGVRERFARQSGWAVAKTIHDLQNHPRVLRAQRSAT